MNEEGRANPEEIIDLLKKLIDHFRKKREGGIENEKELSNSPFNRNRSN